MKDYMNSQEVWDIIKMIRLTADLEEFLNEWKKRKNLTKDEHKWMKTAFTLMIKGTKSILIRSDNTTKEKINRRIDTMELYFVDKFQKDNLDRAIQEKVTELHQDKIYRLVEISMYYNCCNCRKKGSECHFYGYYLENLVPTPTGEGYEGQQCKYGYEDEGRK